MSDVLAVDVDAKSALIQKLKDIFQRSSKQFRGDHISLSHFSLQLDRTAFRVCIPGCQKGCYIKETDEVVPFGTNVTPIGPGQCYRISCTEEWLVYASCGVIGNDNPNLTISETDDTKPYPECCPTLVPKTDLTESAADK
ncbi:hypothetical protein evm_014810 [Chilo suppressalis]|nr:hypothetical protein evm_014810 [Chilo suppressalis]